MYNIGIDLGGTNIAVGLVDEAFRLVYQVSEPTGLPKTPEQLADDIHALVVRMLADRGLTEADVGCAGIGIPGTVNQAEGTVEYANNFGFDNVPFVRLLQERFSCRLLAANDAGAAAWGEYLAALREIGYDGYLTIEREVGPDPAADIAMAVNFLKEKLA